MTAHGVKIYIASGIIFHLSEQTNRRPKVTIKRQIIATFAVLVDNFLPYMLENLPLVNGR